MTVTECKACAGTGKRMSIQFSGWKLRVTKCPACRGTGKVSDPPEAAPELAKLLEWPK